MKIVVDRVPIHPQDCDFAEYVKAFDHELIEELVESGEVEYCEDCGGIKVEDEYIKEVFICTRIGERCGLDEYGYCDYLMELPRI